MSGTEDGYAGQETPLSSASDFHAMTFIIERLMDRMATTTIVQVSAVHSAGEVQQVGLLDVVPMIHQVDGYGNPTPHGVIRNVPYFRLQGGTDAVIIDPKVGDIGAAMFCHRDASGVKRSRAPANPGSNRRYDWSDGLYLGGYLNGTPQRFFRFFVDGIQISAPGQKIQFDAANVVINANVQSTGTFTNNGVNISSTHRHGGVQTGGGTTGTPT